MSEFPKIEREHIDVSPDILRKIYEELGTYSVELDENPLLYGIRRLTNKVAQARNMINRVQELSVKFAEYLWQVKRSILRDEALLAMKTSHYLANDPEVRSRPSVSDRKAAVSVLLSDEVVILEEKKLALMDLQMLSDVLKVKNKDLLDTQIRINSQIRLCREEVESLGIKWGSRPAPKGVVERVPLTTGISVGDLLREVEEEMETPLKESPKLKDPEIVLKNPVSSDLGGFLEAASRVDLTSVPEILKDFGDEEGEEVDDFLDLLDPSVLSAGAPEKVEIEEDYDQILDEL